MANKIIAIGVLVIMFCSCNNNSNSQQGNQTKRGCELIEEAYKQGNWDLIISVGDTLIGDDDPQNISIAYAEALAAKGNFEKAINVLNKKIAQTPDDYYLFQTKGNVFTVAEKYDSAIVNYDIVISMKPTYARPYIYEGEIFEVLGNKQKAVSSYLGAMRLFAGHNVIEETLLYCDRILSLDPTNAEAKEYIEQINKQSRSDR